MPKFAYVNGRFVHPRDAFVSVEDRGYQFADSVYEVIGWLDHKPLDFKGHLDRLERSLSELSIPMPMAREVLAAKILQLKAMNLLRDGLIYMQVSRGVAPRDHVPPKTGLDPALVMMAKHTRLDRDPRLQSGIKVVTVPDLRWKRCDIKSTGLLANCMAKQQASEQGAKEAWFITDQQEVVEGGSSTAWIIDHNRRLITRPVGDGHILPGITRDCLIDLLKEMNLQLEERAFTLEEAYQAKEAFITAATSLMVPVTHIDGHAIADGQIGEITEQCRLRYLEAAKATY